MIAKSKQLLEDEEVHQKVEKLITVTWFRWNLWFLTNRNSKSYLRKRETKEQPSWPRTILSNIMITVNPILKEVPFGWVCLILQNTFISWQLHTVNKIMCQVSVPIRFSAINGVPLHLIFQQLRKILSLPSTRWMIDLWEKVMEDTSSTSMRKCN